MSSGLALVQSLLLPLFLSVLEYLICAAVCVHRHIGFILFFDKDSQVKVDLSFLGETFNPVS